MGRNEESKVFYYLIEYIEVSFFPPAWFITKNLTDILEFLKAAKYYSKYSLKSSHEALAIQLQ